jgi:hypothetical protein
MIDDGDCGAIGGMKIGRGNRSTQRNRSGLEPEPPRWEASDYPHELWRGLSRGITFISNSIKIRPVVL